MTAEMSAGRRIGSTTVKVVLAREAPRSRADSSSVESKRLSALPTRRMTKGEKWIAKMTMIGTRPYESQSGTVAPMFSSQPAWPPAVRFLKSESQERAKVQAGSM